MRLNRLFLAALLVALALSMCLGAQHHVSPAQIDSLFASQISGFIPGAAVLVIDHGRTVFKQGYGVAELRTRRKINGQTDFRLASLTKQFTAMGIMLLVHDGKLHYDDRLTSVFPDFPHYGEGITIRHLLNHTSGLPDYEDIMAQQYGNIPDDQIPQISDAGVLALMKKASADKFAPGAQWQYSNSGYCVLAVIVEKVSGQPFGQFLHDRIFAPLKMTGTLAYVKGINEVPNRAYGHTLKEGVWRQTDQSSTSATLGDGGVYTSLNDLARWDAALRNHTLLSEREMEPAITAVKPTDAPAREPDGRAVSYGFGWFVDPYQGHPRMWHYGETVGFRTSIQRFPANQLSVVVLSNRADLDAPGLALKVAELYLKASR
jgi:CubicO group peptidase (beta-lactamase class C family)